MTRMTQLLWVVFAISVAVVIALVLRAPGSGLPERGGGVAARAGAAPPAGARAEPRRDAGEPGVPDAGAKRGAEMADAAAPAGGAVDGEGLLTEAPSEAEGAPADEEGAEETSMEPADFMARLFELAREGNLEALTALMRPGAVKLLRQPLTGLLTDADATREGLEVALQDLTFRFEERSDGALRLHLEGLAPGALPDAPLYLLPDADGGWKLAAESDLPGPAAEAERARARLQLLAVCQGTYFMEGLGFGDGYAPTARDLADGLERSGVYGGALAPELVAAADAGRPLDGYILGRLPSAANEVFYYAIPAAPGSGPRDTLVIDGRGKIWAKDLEGGPLPAEWPAGDPSREGWREQREEQRK